MRILFFATNSFPYGKDEPLIAEHINVLSKEFDKIIITSICTKKNVLYNLGDNITSYHFSNTLSLPRKIWGLTYLFSKNIREEIKFIKSTYKVGVSFSVIKVLLNSYNVSKQYSRLYNKIIKEQKFQKEELFFHSYWCTEAVIGYVLLKNKYPKARMTSRFHAYDLYFERHSPEYLPLRKLIIDNLNKLFFISTQGKEYFKNIFSNYADEKKLVVNRLGVNLVPAHEPVSKKEVFKGLRVVSCSAIIDLKRIHLMIEAIALIDNISIEWLHFGEGSNLSKLQTLATLKLGHKQNIKYSFAGFIDNHALLEYYQTNQVDLFLNTSQYEGVPISIMEAMANRIPSIATNVGGVSEIIDSNNGYLLPVNFQPIDLTKLLEHYFFLSEKEKNEMKENAFIKWNQTYNGAKNSQLFLKELLPTYQMCTRCVYDTTDYPDIKFDEAGVCSVCNIYDELHKKTVLENEFGQHKLNELLHKIKSDGANKPYDCLIGVSGGVDSSYLAYLAKQWGLRPLILHVDNGWNSELAIQNIENIVQLLGFDLNTYVINWEEMRDIQLSFLKASVLDIDVPFDHAIMAVLYKIAIKHNIKHVLSGVNTVTEGWMPPNFTHYKMDTMNIKSIHKQFGEVKLKNFPLISPIKKWFLTKLYGIEFASPLDYIRYNKEEVKEKLIQELNWRDYGGKHYENFYTKFYQGYILPEKFKVDKRKAHLSTLICSHQITKEIAFKELEKPPYEKEELSNDIEYFSKKMGLTVNEFNEIMSLPIKRHTDYASYINVIEKLRKIKKAGFF